MIAESKKFKFNIQLKLILMGLGIVAVGAS